MGEHDRVGSLLDMGFGVCGGRERQRERDRGTERERERQRAREKVVYNPKARVTGSHFG